MTVRFDDSLGVFVRTISEVYGDDYLNEAVFLREAGGRLSVTLPKEISLKARTRGELAVANALGGYARSGHAVNDISSPSASRLRTEAELFPRVNIENRSILFLDRRIIGQDWLQPPTEKSRIPRIVFASLKGGVGRSTALCVLAAHLSRRGRRILAVDFDLEAPGLGTMLLDESELPAFGTLDYLVENGLSGVDDEFLADLSGDSFLGAEGGRVTVIPAIGRRTVDNPANALAKIARAYLEDTRPNTPPVGLGAQLREMIERFENTDAYDVILVDVRAGLHETTGAALLGLGAELLFFGVDLPQTYLGYRLLLAHLSRTPPSLGIDWREAVWFVNAKASESAEARAAAEDRFVAVYQEFALPTLEARQPDLTADDIEVEWQETRQELSDVDELGSPVVLHIGDDARYRGFDPVNDRSLLASSTYSATFDEIIDFGDLFISDEKS